MARNLLDYDVAEPMDWQPLKRLANAVIERHILDLAESLEWLKNWEESTKEYKKRTYVKQSYRNKLRDLNHAYYFLCSEQITILSNHETRGEVMHEKIDKYLNVKYGVKFCNKYIKRGNYEKK